jgi:hypothetical protein
MSWDRGSEDSLEEFEELLRRKRAGKLHAQHMGEISVYSLDAPHASGEAGSIPRSESLIAEAIELEKQFAANNGQGLASNPTYLVYPEEISRPKVIITAPHAVVHWRDGTEWVNQVYTGPLAMQLAKQQQGQALVLAKSTSGEAPNFYPNSPFKQRLLKLATIEPRPIGDGYWEHLPLVVLDLHGIPASWEWDMYIGTGRGTTLRNTPFLDTLIARLRFHGILSLGIDAPGWSATSAVTIAQTVAQQADDTPALQLAISRTFRDPVNRPAEYKALFTALSEAISAMEAYRQ